ncbi:MAG: Uma2 family endonuclease [Anaerolineae bacterium]|nr:Uma2 family endonuclease [Anaerolineae bacterium]
MTLLQTKIGMPLAEFMEAVEAQPFELINGERRIKLPNVFGHSKVIRLLFLLFYQFTQLKREGEVYTETTFIMPNKADTNWVEGSRIPDLMYFAGTRIADYEAQNPDHNTRPLALVPDLVIEVVSPNDKVSELDEKIDAYLLDGVRLIWVVDPQRRKATVYAPDMEQPLHLNVNGMLDGDDVLPEFQVALADIFRE